MDQMHEPGGTYCFARMGLVVCSLLPRIVLPRISGKQILTKLCFPVLHKLRIITIISGNKSYHDHNLFPASVNCASNNYASEHCFRKSFVIHVYGR